MLIPSDVTAPCWKGRPLDTDIAHLADDIPSIADLEQLHIEIQKMTRCCTEILKNNQNPSVRPRKERKRKN
jgi:hypothetical protein